MHENTQRDRKDSSQDEMPLWMSQVVDAFDAGQNIYGQLSKDEEQKPVQKEAFINSRIERLEILLQEKGAALVPRGEWGKFISWLIKEHLDEYSPQHSAIFAFTAGYAWQKNRKNWVSRNVHNLRNNSDLVPQLAEDLRSKIAYHWYCYNILDWPEISDHDYDSMVRELQNLESVHPDIRQPAEGKRCITRWLYDVEKLLEADFANKGELPPPKTVKKRRGKLDPELLHRFMDAIPDEPVEIVPDEDWQTAFSTFFERHFQKHTMLTTCRTAFVAGAAWHKYRDALDQ